MRLTWSIFLFPLAANAVLADSVVALKTLQPREIVRAEHVALHDIDIPGAATALDEVVGSEVIRAVYAGRPVLTENLTAPASVERNAQVRAVYSLNGLLIEIEARALERGAAGDVIRAMNLSSRTTIAAEVQQDGHLRVLP